MQPSSKVTLKILIDYEQYLKLKSYEKEVQALNAKKTEALRITKEKNEQSAETAIDKSHSQIGSGLEVSSALIQELSTAVANQISQQFNLKALQQLVPTPTPSELIQTGEGNTSNDLLPPIPSHINFNISAPAASDFVKHKSQQFDEFDVNKLISSVPIAYHTRAKNLIEKITQNPLEIDFNTKGQLYLDGIEIPQANIFQIFPELYRRKLKKNLPGKDELVTKIASKGWGTLIVRGIVKGLKRPKNYQCHNETLASLKEFKNWWYMSM